MSFAFFLRLASGFSLAVALTATSTGFNIRDSGISISSQEETEKDTSLAPCKNSERLNAVRALLVKLGAQPDSISIEKMGGVENLVVRKQGKSPESIIIGAHYDKVDEGCGAIDNWTGIVALAHVYRSLKDADLQKSLIFVAFGKEERGLVGSRAMARDIKKEELNQYCAMINIDSLGMAAPQVPENLSNKSLVNRVLELAQRMKIPFNKVNIPYAGADSQSFIDKKIPALTISAVADGWTEVLHTKNDQVARVNATSVYLGYRLALALVSELDGLPCDVSRSESKAK